MRDNEAYEYATATVAAEDSSEVEGSDAFAIAAGMAREMLRAIWTASGGDADRLRLLLMRGGGMTLEEIGAAMGCSYQAVQCRMRRMTRRHPELAFYIRSGNPLDLYTEMTGHAEKKTDAK